MTLITARLEILWHWNETEQKKY